MMLLVTSNGPCTNSNSSFDLRPFLSDPIRDRNTCTLYKQQYQHDSMNHFVLKLRIIAYCDIRPGSHVQRLLDL